MRIAVVGNGPSALGKAEVVDARDTVIRTGQYTRVFKHGEAGAKTTAWAWPGYDKMNRMAPKSRRVEWWITCPWQWHKGKARQKNVTALATRKKIRVRVVPLELYMRVRHWVRYYSQRTVEFPPTTGMLAIAMALEQKPEELLICGFDAGRGYADGRDYNRGLHDYFAERLMLQALRGGKWLGQNVAAALDWRTE